MPLFIENDDGSLSVRIYYTDLSVEAIEEIDAGLKEYGRGILYDHFIEEFGVSSIEIPALEPVVSLGNFKDHLNKS